MIRNDVLYLPPPRLILMKIICSYDVVDQLTKDFDVINYGVVFLSGKRITCHYCETEDLSMLIWSATWLRQSYIYIEDIINPYEWNDSEINKSNL